MTSEINKRIRYYREQKKISQEKLGEAIGMKCNAYSRMEREGNITVDDVHAIADVLGINPDLIFYGEEKKKELDFTPIEPPILTVNDPFKNSFLSDGPSLFVKYTSGDFELSNEEKAMITIFRNLSDEKKEYIRDYLSNNY